MAAFDHVARLGVLEELTPANDTVVVHDHAWVYVLEINPKVFIINVLVVLVRQLQRVELFAVLALFVVFQLSIVGLPLAGQVNVFIYQVLLWVFHDLMLPTRMVSAAVLTWPRCYFHFVVHFEGSATIHLSNLSRIMLLRNILLTLRQCMIFLHSILLVHLGAVDAGPGQILYLDVLFRLFRKHNLRSRVLQLVKLTTDSFHWILSN